MVHLLLDDDEYVDAIQDLLEFAEKHELTFDGTSSRLLELAMTLMMALDEEDSKSFVFLGKLIYNVGYRDNLFSKNNTIH